jgi:hypothetical protein
MRRDGNLCVSVIFLPYPGEGDIKEEVLEFAQFDQHIAAVY